MSALPVYHGGEPDPRDVPPPRPRPRARTRAEARRLQAAGVRHGRRYRARSPRRSTLRVSDAVEPRP
jgi:hypothetical protein